MLRFVFSILVVAILTAGSVTADTISENKDLVRKFISAGNARDYEKLPTYIAEDFERHSDSSPNVSVTNRDQFIAHMRDGDAMFLETKYYIQQIIAEGDRVAVWASYRGSVAGKGSAPMIDIDVPMIFRIEGGHIAELWVLWDNNALRSQLNAHQGG